MLQHILTLGKGISKANQRQILGGNQCISCYDNCVRISQDRIELGECFDGCRIYC